MWTGEISHENGPVLVHAAHDGVVAQWLQLPSARKRAAARARIIKGVGPLEAAVDADLEVKEDLRERAVETANRLQHECWRQARRRSGVDKKEDVQGSLGLGAGRRRLGGNRGHEGGARAQWVDLVPPQNCRVSDGCVGKGDEWNRRMADWRRMASRQRSCEGGGMHAFFCDARDACRARKQ